MTAEIAILNRNAIALAADSAITIGSLDKRSKQRVWKTSNKIFSLAPENDIAIMIYGTGDFCGVPWETLIKLFSQQKNRLFDTVDSCKIDFLKFVKSFKLYDENLEQLNTLSLVVACAEDAAIAGSKGLNKTDQKRLVNEYLDEMLTEAQEFDTCEASCTDQEFSDNYRELAENTLQELVDFSVPNTMKKKLVRYCFDIAQKRVPSGLETGVVFAGFGSDEYLPALCSVTIDGKTCGGLRFWDKQGAISMETWKESAAFIQPFAQGDVAHLFIEGIDLDYMDYLEGTILAAFDKNSQDVVDSYVPDGEKVVEIALQKKANKAALKSLMDDFSTLRRKRVVDQMLQVVRSLPREEMAAMAESLVEITSLRRRVDSDVESVSGPVDVLIISKGDGLIWMKRKHYFEGSLNSDFKYRRSMRRNGKND